MSFWKKLTGFGKAKETDVAYARELDEVKALLRKDPGVVFRESPNGSGTLLHKAAAKGHKKIVELLLANGADVNSNAAGATPLQFAAILGNKDVVELLLANGANVDAKDSEGRTPLQVVEGVQRNSPQKSRADVIKLLRKHGGTKGQNFASGTAPARQPAPNAEAKPASTTPTSPSPANCQVSYRGLTFQIDGEYSLVCDDKRIVRGIWYRHREDVKNAMRNRMVVAAAGVVKGYRVLDSDYETTIVGGIGGVEELNNPGGAILWFASARELLGQ